MEVALLLAEVVQHLVGVDRPLEEADRPLVEVDRLLAVADLYRGEADQLPAVVVVDKDLVGATGDRLVLVYSVA